MFRRSRIRVAAKWAVTVAFIAVVTCWAAGVGFDLQVTRGYSVHMNEGGFSVKMWPWPRPDFDAFPDTHRVPFWFASLALLVLAAGLWGWDRARTPRAAPRPSCPTCGRKLA